MSPAAHLSALLDFRSYRDGAVWQVSVADIVGEWRDLGHGDERLAQSLDLCLRARIGRPAPVPGGEITVVEKNGEPVVVAPGGATIYRVADLLAAARELIGGASAESVAVKPTKGPAEPRQFSLF